MIAMFNAGRPNRQVVVSQDHKYCPECFRKLPGSANACPEHGGSLISIPEEESLVGQVVDDKYEILDKLGKGGMGVVYRARQKYVNREVALKVLRRDFARDVVAVKRFFVEARAASMLKSRHSVVLYDFGMSSEGLLYFTMELLDGVSVAEEIRRSGALGVGRALTAGVHVCRSLEEAHGKGVVHRDLKPDNIFLVEEDGEEVAKVLDFGIAKVLARKDESSLTIAGMLCGTPEYVSPEQAGGEPVGPRSDLYSLGVVLYEMLSGLPPFMGETPVMVLMKHLEERPTILSLADVEHSIPEELEQLVLRLLSKDPERRPASALELRESLQEILREVASGGAHPEEEDKTASDDRREVESGGHAEAVRALTPFARGGIAIAGGVAALLAALLFAFGVLPIETPEREKDEPAPVAAKEPAGRPAEVNGHDARPASPPASAPEVQVEVPPGTAQVTDALTQAAPAVVQDVVEDEPSGAEAEEVGAVPELRSEGTSSERTEDGNEESNPNGGTAGAAEEKKRKEREEKKRKERETARRKARVRALVENGKGAMAQKKYDRAMSYFEKARLEGGNESELNGLITECRKRKAKAVSFTPEDLE